MKKKNLICLFSALMLFSLSNVKAVDFNKGSKFNVVKDGTANTQGFSYGGYTYNGELKYYTTFDNKQYTAYCEDPANYGGGNYEVVRVLGANTQQDHINAYDNGILAILSNGYNQFNSSLKLDNGSVVSGNDLYVATSIAQRAFTLANRYGKQVTELSAQYKAKASSLVTLAIRWSGMYYGSEADYSANYYIRSCKNKSCVENKIKGFYSWYDGKTNLTPAGEGSTSYNVILAAQKLFKMGVKAQGEYASGSSSKFSVTAQINGNEKNTESSNVTDKKYATVVDEEDTNTNNGNYYMYATIDVKNMSSQTGYIKNLKIDCPTCSGNGVTIGDIEYSYESKNWQKLDADTDITQGLKTENGLKSGTINIRFAYERKSSKDDCTPDDFKLYYDYFNTPNDIKGVVLKDLQGNNKQRFFAVSKSSDEGNNPINTFVEGIIYCGQGEACKTELQVPVCSDGGSKTEDSCESVTKTFYSTSQVFYDEKAKTYTYEIQFNNLPKNIKNVTISNASYFDDESLTDYEAYINQNKELTMTNNNANLNVNLQYADVFKFSSLKKNNFKFVVNSPYYDSKDEKYKTKVTVTVINTDDAGRYGADVYDRPIHFVPIKFDVTYVDKDTCINNNEDSEDKTTSSEELSTAKIKAPEDIKKCIINNVDDAGNTYQLSKDNNGVDNSYCKVFCKEDYAEIKLNPVIEDVVCGGYFQLKSSVKGSKDCYTGSTKSDLSINKEKYIEDIIAAQKQMIEGYNLVLKANAADAAEFEDKSCSGCGGCSQSWYEKSGTYNGIEPGEINADGVVAVKGTEFSFSYGYSGRCSRKSCSTDSEGHRSCHCGGSCSSGSSKSEVRDEISAEREKGEKMMKEGMEAYKNAISNLNACTTGWSNDYKFAQKLEFYYDEGRYEEDNYTKYYDLLNDESKYLEAKEDTLKESSSISICTGTVNNKYECETEAINYDGKFDDAEKYKRDEYNYSSEFDKVFTTKQYTVCDKNGCTGNTRKISTATYVKKTVEKEQEYITPTSFYQIAVNGKIMTYEGFAKDKVQAAALENALPVSTSVVGGGTFRLMLQDLGEFYNAKNEFGRLIDFTSEGMNEKSVAYAQDQNGIETTFDGNYKCYYKSSCRPKECPNCEFICDDDVCEWKECPTCKFTCVNCVFNFDELKLNVKTISTTNFDSVGRTFGYNWITSSSMKALELLNNKASKTISEIKETNEMVYQDDKTSEDSSLAFSVKMTPEVTREILKWNEEGDTKGGYLDSTLTCYDAVIDGQTYKNIYCYSKNIDKLVDDFSDEVTVINRPKTDAERKNYTKYKESDKGYWTLWEGFLTLNKNEVGSAVKTNEETGETYQVLGGPSWK